MLCSRTRVSSSRVTKEMINQKRRCSLPCFWKETFIRKYSHKNSIFKELKAVKLWTTCDLSFLCCLYPSCLCPFPCALCLSAPFLCGSCAFCLAWKQLAKSKSYLCQVLPYYPLFLWIYPIWLTCVGPALLWIAKSWSALWSSTARAHATNNETTNNTVKTFIFWFTT